MWGILSVIFDLDVVDYPDAGPLLGPAMAATAGVVTFLSVLGALRAKNPWPTVFSAAVLTAAAMVLVGGIGYSIAKDDVTWMPAAAVHFAIRPFVPGAAVLAAVAVVASWAVARYPGQGSSQSGII